MSKSITITEFDRLSLSGTFNSNDIPDLLAQNNRVFSIQNNQLSVANYVGIFTTKSGVVIEILPKVDLGSDADDQNEKTRELFLTMLRHWRGMGFQNLTNSQIRTVRKFPMLEAFVYLFLVNVRELVRYGLARRYINVEENLTYLRGRLLFSEQFRENLVDQSSFYVSHDEFSENRPANRLIHKALEILSTQVKDTSNFQLLHQVKVAFSEVPPSQNLYADWQSHHIDRTMQSYKNVMAWVKLLLFNEGLTTFSGSHENVSLLFPMEEVFEDFVTYSFMRHQNSFKVKAQGPQKPLATINSQNVFRMKPDISLMQGKSVFFILDAKWKRIDAQSSDLKHNIDQHDMYQLFAYGTNYMCKAVALVFPQTEQFAQPLRYKFQEGDLTLLCLPFDVQHPKLSVEKSMKALEEYL